MKGIRGNGVGISSPRTSERGLDVDLSELHLPVRPQIFVTEAACDLEIPLHARHHQDLLELLGRLRKCIKLPRVDARRHQVFAGAFRRALEECWRLHLDELLRVKVVADRLRRAMPHFQVAAHLRPAQVQVTVGEPQVLVHLVAPDVVQRERRRFGNVVDIQRAGHDLDLARREVLVVRALRPAHDLAGDADDRLRLQVLQLLGQFRVIVRLELDLRDAAAVTEVDKDDAALIADRVDPPEERYDRVDVGYG